MKLPIFLKLLFAVILLFALGIIGLFYVAPRGALKTSREVSRTNAANYGMRNDRMLAVSEDSLNLYGDLIYPFHVNQGETIPNKCLIILHELNANSEHSYRTVKPLITLPLNFLTTDIRSHGRSQGDFFYLGAKETQDISTFIDLVLELHPKMEFGILAKGLSGNIALKAMEQDKRIQYGIVETAVLDPMEYLRQFNMDDLGLENNLIANEVFEGAIDYHNISLQDVTLFPFKVDQPILFITKSGDEYDSDVVYDQVSSQDKFQYTRNVDKPISAMGNPSWSEYINCIREFLQIYAL